MLSVARNSTNNVISLFTLIILHEILLILAEIRPFSFFLNFLPCT